MDLTPEQRAAVEAESHRILVLGGPGTGKTAVVLERHRRLTARHPTSRVLVLTGHRAAARRFSAAAVPHLRGGFDALPVTTVYGLAFDLVRRSRGEVALAPAAERRALVARLLASDDRSLWPLLGHLLGRPGFAAEVATSLATVTEAGVVAARAAGGRWAELAAFAERHGAALAPEDGRLDPAALLAAATECAPNHRHRFDHLLVDDLATLPAPARALVDALAGESLAVTATAESMAEAEVEGGVAAGATRFHLLRPFRVAPPGRLVVCRHPSVEAEAVAGELLAARREGVAWSEMAVLVRQLGRRARAVGRALARHGVPVVPVAALAPEEPVVRAVVDLLRWAEGGPMPARLLASPLARLHPHDVRRIVHDARARGGPLEDDPRVAGLVALRDHLHARLEAGATPADLAYEAWARGLSDLGSTGLGAVDDRALDGLVALVDGLAAFADRHPGAGLAGALAALDDGELVAEPWRGEASAGSEGVTITSIASSVGLEWRTVVVTGCVEGELPRVPARAPLFDPAALGGPVPDPMAAERRLFALATTRATGSLVATAAPEPGVLLSRFVEAWPVEGPRLPMAPGRRAPPRAVTSGVAPVWRGGELRLSASQLDTYDECPLRYSFQYVLRAREEPGVHAALGTIAHEVLRVFLDPSVTDPPPRTLEGLLAVADSLWDDGIARYRPQAEEARRDLLAMLTGWWEREGNALPEVLAVERGFDIPVGPHRLVGSIDRVDRGPGGSLRVVDYKTGKSEPRAGEVADDLQLAVYHLAATLDPELSALGPPTELQLLYLRSLNVHQQPVTDDHADRTTARVLEAAGQILEERFPPSVDANCRVCPFHRLCPLQPEGRQVEAG